MFREPTESEVALSDPTVSDAKSVADLVALVPNETIPEGNVHTVMGSGYGCKTFGDLMNHRQSLSFAAACLAGREVHAELLASGLSIEYSRALTSFVGAALVRRLRRSTRGCSIQSKGRLDGSVSNTIFISDLFVNQCNLNYQFDYFETGLGEGASTWSSISASTVQAIRKVLDGQSHPPVRLRMASATALPVRDSSVDVVITDPPYYDMVEYADGSDLFHVWLKRLLFDIEPDLFGADVQPPDGPSGQESGDHRAAGPRAEPRSARYLLLRVDAGQVVCRSPAGSEVRRPPCRRLWAFGSGRLAEVARCSSDSWICCHVCLAVPHGDWSLWSCVD